MEALRTLCKLLCEFICWIPKQIKTEELIVRIIVHPYHFNKSGKNLSASALKSPPDKDEVSVIRHTYRDADFGKLKAKQLEDENKKFRGFLVWFAGEIRDYGSEIIDTRNIYCGHADIKHGIIPKRGKPLPPEFNERLNNLIKKAGRYYFESNPENPKWTGSQLK